MNAEEVFAIERTPAFPSYRVASAFYYRADNSRFPFDTQRLDVVIEESLLEVQDRIFVVDPSLLSVHPDVSLQGWTWDKDSIQHQVLQNHYPVVNQTYSRVKFSWVISRAQSVSTQLLLPPLLMMTGVLVSFSLDPGAVFMRVSIVQSAFVSLTMLHTGQVRELGTGNPMLFDYFMIVCYVICSVCILVNVAISLLWQAGKRRQELARELNQKSRWICWLICPGIYCFLFVQWYIAIFVLILPAPIVLGCRKLIRCIREERAKRMVRDTAYDSDDSSSDEHQTRMQRVDKDEAAEEAKELGELARTVSQKQIQKQVLDREKSRDQRAKDEDSQLYGMYDDLSDGERAPVNRTLANTKIGATSSHLSKVSKMGSSAKMTNGSKPQNPHAARLAHTTKASGSSSAKLGFMSKLFGASSAKLSRESEAGQQQRGSVTKGKQRESVRVTPTNIPQPSSSSSLYPDIERGQPKQLSSQPSFVSAAPSFARVIKDEDESSQVVPQPSSPAKIVVSPPAASSQETPALQSSSTSHKLHALHSQTSMANLAASISLPKKLEIEEPDIRSPEEPSDSDD